MRYEVEVKVEITHALAEKLLNKLPDMGFSQPTLVWQIDRYVGPIVPPAVRPLRYRAETPKAAFGDQVTRYFRTRKLIEREPNDQERLVEDEVQISSLAFAQETSRKIADKVTLRKRRYNFSGRSAGLALVVSIDAVDFDHCVATRFFLEPEVLTERADQVEPLKAQILTLISELISVPVADIKSSAGLYAIASKKLEPETVYG